ncbi:ATP-binding cassette domain-containing protein [Aeromicrobium sp. SMF47]|uniref:metal ABC transporter ATP-binding protein n=1 Tax=Aeromicrobium TaxID=2040 RepID=UPI0013C15E2F|nr:MULTISPECIES: metal ABC transporter ATP-binding protein [Aeromicrobium]MRJ76849.1 ATP-binding cassette domain-containing protein [Aeromicrobium yanjiei]MRK01193.1 ATP-binding cassette domain-containing protein [Aeromicrobium sp. S22]
MPVSQAPPLVVRGVGVALDGRPVLRHVDLEVAAGEFVALLGSNGSGKSTLVRAAVGLVPISSGSIELFGTPLDRFRDRQRLGYVPQRTRAVSGVPATVREVVMSGRLARRRFFGWRTAADVAAVDAAIDRVGLSDRSRSSVSEMSGGQQQRALIARALASEAELLIMDEPTAGVDHDNQESLAELLGSLVQDGTSVLLVAHELGPLRPLIDRAIVLHDGEIEYSGPCDAIRDEQLTHVHRHGGQPDHPDGFSPNPVGA